MSENTGAHDEYDGAAPGMTRCGWSSPRANGRVRQYGPMSRDFSRLSRPPQSSRRRRPRSCGEGGHRFAFAVFGLDVRKFEALCLVARERRADALVRDRHGVVAQAPRSGPRSRATGPLSLRDGCSSTWRGCCRRARSSSNTSRSTECWNHLRAGELQADTYSAEDFPKLPAVEGAQTFAVDSSAFLETVSRVRARRGTSRALCSRALPFASRARNHHGRYGLVPDVREGSTELSGDTASELEAIVPARALTELSRIAQDSGELQIGVRRTTSCSASPSADDAPDRRPVPELLAAAARRIDTRRRCRARSSSRSCAELLVMAQRNSPLRLRFAEGEVTVSAQTQDVGAGEGSRCRFRSPASRSRSGSTRTSCATASSSWRATRPALG